MKTRNNRIMIIELLIFFSILVFVTVVITGAIVMSRNYSLKAEKLTEAVIIAENTAEIAKSSDSLDDLTEKLGKLYAITSKSSMESQGMIQAMGSLAADGGPDIFAAGDADAEGADADTYSGADTGSDTGSDISATGNADSGADSDSSISTAGNAAASHNLYAILVERFVEEKAGGRFIRDVVTIYDTETDDGPLYFLDTAHFAGGEASDGA